MRAVQAEVRLLGPLEVDGPGGRLRLSGSRQRTLLALLALRAPEVLSRAQLIDALWGTVPPATAVKTLHSHIARVRQALAGVGLGELLVTREPGYALRLAPQRLDVARFEEHVRGGRRALRMGDPAGADAALRAGLALWRGDPLADCPVAEWGQAEITRLNEARAGAAEATAEAGLMLGEHAGVVAELERLVGRYPLRERFWELLVIAHYRGGCQAEALRAYRRARTVLLGELGVEPGPALRRLEAEVLAGVGELDRPTAPVAPAVVPVAGPECRSPTGLPVATTSLVGRYRELSDVLGLLTASRLVTLTGPGGCGKTRLALRAASEVAAAGNHTVVLVDLAQVSDPELVADAVAAAFGVAERPGVVRADTLVETLAADGSLVVLDNCERHVRSCATLVNRLLTACPGLSVLATSREALRVAGEMAYEVPPLTVPDPAVPRTLAELIAYDSVRLFLDRAADHCVPAFGDDDAPVIAHLCAALDGLPLAIELAAAQTPVHAPAQVVRRLRDRFGLLSVDARHRALRATMAWSHDLLTTHEAALFARLGVFAGGFSVAAVEAVVDSEHPLDDLSVLVAKSLVRSHRHGGVTRYAMLKTIAAYAIERLTADPAVEADARRRHALFFLDLAERADTDLTGELLGELAIEHDNLRAAMTSLALAPDATAELRLATALRRYCHLHGHYREGRRWLDHALARTEGTRSPVRVRALAGAASMALLNCDYPEAIRHATMGLRLAEGFEDHRMTGRLQRLLASVARERAEYAEALRLYRASGESFRTVGDELGIANSFLLAGATAWLSGDLDAADQALTTGLALMHALGDQDGIASSLAYLGAVALYRHEVHRSRELLETAFDQFSNQQFKEGIAWTLNLLGLVEHATGHPDQAAPLLRTSLTLHRELGDRWRQASVLEAIAAVACATGELDRAAGLLRQAEQLRQTIGSPVPMIERAAVAHMADLAGYRRTATRH